MNNTLNKFKLLIMLLMLDLTSCVNTQNQKRAHQRQNAIDFQASDFTNLNFEPQKRKRAIVSEEDFNNYFTDSSDSENEISFNSRSDFSEEIDSFNEKEISSSIKNEQIINFNNITTYEALIEKLLSSKEKSIMLNGRIYKIHKKIAEGAKGGIILISYIDENGNEIKNILKYSKEEKNIKDFEAEVEMHQAQQLYMKELSINAEKVKINGYVFLIKDMVENGVTISNIIKNDNFSAEYLKEVLFKYFEFLVSSSYHGYVVNDSHFANVMIKNANNDINNISFKHIDGDQKHFDNNKFTFEEILSYNLKNASKKYHIKGGKIKKEIFKKLIYNNGAFQQMLSRNNLYFNYAAKEERNIIDSSVLLATNYLKNKFDEEKCSFGKWMTSSKYIPEDKKLVLQRFKAFIKLVYRLKFIDKENITQNDMLNTYREIYNYIV